MLEWTSFSQAIIFQYQSSVNHDHTVHTTSTKVLLNFTMTCSLVNVALHYELDGVGSVDNRPSTDKLHHFVEKKQKNM